LENIRFNVVSFTLLQNGRFSEIKETQNEIPFDDYWKDFDSINIIKDWDKIKALVVFNSKCFNCGRDTQVHFRPDGIRPIYCKDCRIKYRKKL
jgi:CxxC-x17-CxxC domain-containing protein